MTVTINRDSGNYGALFTPLIYARGDMKFLSGNINFPSSYITGGHVMDLASHFKNLLGVMFETKSGYIFEYDYTNKKAKAMQHLRNFTVSVDLPSINANATADVAITVTGIGTSDRLVEVIPAAALDHGLVVQRIWVSGANTVTARISNLTAGAIDAAAANWTFVTKKDIAQEVPSATNLSAVTGVRFFAWGY